MFGRCLFFTYLCQQFPNINPTHTYIMSATSEYFRRRRVELGLTQAQLAAAAGVGRNAVINWEAGKGVRPSTVAAIRKVLGA